MKQPLTPERFNDLRRISTKRGYFPTPGDVRQLVDTVEYLHRQRLTDQELDDLRVCLLHALTYLSADEEIELSDRRDRVAVLVTRLEALRDSPW